MQSHADRSNKADTAAEAVHWTVETDDYDAGMAEVRTTVPEGWGAAWGTGQALTAARTTCSVRVDGMVAY